MLGSSLVVFSIATLTSAWLAAHPPGGSETRLPAAAAASHIRTRGDRFEWVDGGLVRPIFFRGVNLGAGAPGHFPGEFAFSKADYARYLRFARGLNANAIRVYTLHPPALYEALLEENLAHPDRPLWLFQGVWAELPESNDLQDEAFTRGFEADLGTVVDAIHGNAEVDPRPGHAAGRYAADVSPWIAGWLLGREWEPYAVRETERRHPGPQTFRGEYFAADGVTAAEAWFARICDAVVAQERARYGLAHAVSFVNWPTLDVIQHPTESEPGGREAAHDEDAWSVDPRRIRPLREAGLASGFLGYFASYHVYPYYPDFLGLDPGYSATRDRHGACNYAGYLADLKGHLGDLPLLVGEFGIPSSRGISHRQPQGLDHGGASEIGQGEQVARLLEDIVGANCAGALLFSLFDEWFKANWLTWDVEQPRGRDPLWHNLLDAEEGFGLIAFDPPSRIQIDGSVSDWHGIAPHATAERSPGRQRPMVRSLHVTSDAARLYLRLDLDPGALRRDPPTLGVAIDVLDPRRGDTRLPAPLDATWSRGAEFVLLIEPGRDRANRDARAELFCDRRMSWSLYARRHEDGGFVRHERPLRTEANDDGRYAPLVVSINRERVSRDGVIFPEIRHDLGRLVPGREPRPARTGDGPPARPYEPHADWWLDRRRGVVEIALPWGLLGVGDPSSHAVLDDVAGTPQVETSRTQGIGLLAWATRAPGFRADSLGPSAGAAAAALPEAGQFIGPPGTTQSIVGSQVRVLSPDTVSYLWNGWERPITRERVKLSAAHVRKAFEEIASREQDAYREYNALLQDRAPTRRPRRSVRRACRRR